MARSKFPEQELLLMTDLEQIKVLADPLRIRLLENFAEERTTKQVADLIGEKATKLYHHVDALERVGLIRLVRTRQNRGTLEKYFQAVARRFEADPRLFDPEEGNREEQAETLRTMTSTILDSTRRELHELIDRGEGPRTIDEAGLLSYTEVWATVEELKQFRERLKAVLESIADACCKEPEDDDDTRERYRLTLTYFPLPPRPED